MAKFITIIISVIFVQSVLSFDQKPARAYDRLPTSLKPVKYLLWVQPFFPAEGVQFEPELNFTFKGQLLVEIKCLEETRNITMHMDGINISTHPDYRDPFIFLFEFGGGQDIPVKAYSYDDQSQQVTFHLAEPHSLKPGLKYKFHINYSGKLNWTDRAGFYMSHYVEEGKTKWMASTQFEPSDARRLLPCFDEPHYKAVFYVEITHPTSMVALSNGMELGTVQTPQGGWSMTSFAPSPIMSTYLLALAVADYRSKSAFTKDNKTLVRVWTRPSFINRTDYAVFAGRKVLDYFNDYFHIPFPLPKLDMISIPQFNFGAMENWGLVTYAEGALLYDDDQHTIRVQQAVASTIAHELAHQWFGNLVTMEWWDDLWLNEGFATYYDHIGADVISDGRFNMDVKFVTNTQKNALQVDGEHTSNPLHSFVPGELQYTITYDKGASVIRMLNYTLSEQVFRSGIRAYLKRNSYANVNYNHLWEALTDAASDSNVLDWDSNPLNVSDFMSPWVRQSGYPVVDVRRTYGGHRSSKPEAIVTQKPFQGRNQINPRPAYYQQFLKPIHNSSWYLPLRYSTGDNPSEVRSAWLQPNKPLTIDAPDDQNWLLVNQEAAAYCRVNYDRENWRLIRAQLETDFSKIDEKSRARLEEDALELAKAGYLPYDIALDTTAYLVNETAMEPWKTSMDCLDYIEQRLTSSPAAHTAYNAYILSLTKGLYERYGFKPVDDISSHYLRRLAVEKQCGLGAPDCVQIALRHFRRFYDACDGNNNYGGGLSGCNNNDIDPDLRSIVYCVGAREDDENSSHFNFLSKLFLANKEESDSLEKARLLAGMKCTKNAANKLKYLAFEAIMKPASPDATGEEQVEKPNSFKDKYLVGREARMLKQEREEAENKQWMENNYDLVVAWFNNYNQ